MKIRFISFFVSKIKETYNKRRFRILAGKMQRQMRAEMKDLTNIPKVEMIRDATTLTKIFRSGD